MQERRQPRPRVSRESSRGSRRSYNAGMRYTAEPAFVLHARAWRETSLLVEVLSAEHGRLGLVARGVQGPKRHVLRAALQPLQSIRFDGVQRGQLVQLTGPRRWMPRRCCMAMPRWRRSTSTNCACGWRRGTTRRRRCTWRIAGPERLRACACRWTLRRFERDALQALGSGFDYAGDGDGAPLDPAARYRFEAEHGARRVRGERVGARGDSATGRACWRWART